MGNKIEMKIAKAAAEHWQMDEPMTLEDAIDMTGKSEIASVIGIVRTLGLDDKIIDQLIGELDDEKMPIGNGIIYTSETIPEEIASQIASKIRGSDSSKNVLNILSTVHDSWVRNNPNNFMKVNDEGKRRNKERQFVPLQLLNWAEVENDLVFLKPILEAAGIEIDIEALKREFGIMQQEYLIDNKIFSHEDLVNHLMKGSKKYEALEGLETKFGGKIDDLLQEQQIAEETATQIESSGVQIKTKEELAKEITESRSEELDEVFWIETVESDDPNFDKEKLPNINGPISRREVMLSKLTGKPYPEYIFDGIEDYKHDRYKAEVRRPRDGEWDIADAYRKKIVGQRKGVTAEGIAKTDKKNALVKSETSGIKGFFENLRNKLQNLFKGKGEK